jgi:hypothetical protein
MSSFTAVIERRTTVAGLIHEYRRAAKRSREPPGEKQTMGFGTAQGTRLSVAFNRTRWRDDRVVVWLSTQRATGRGEGSSGLRFDTLVDSPFPTDQ